MTDEYDVERKIHDEWIKLMNYIADHSPDELADVQQMNKDYGEFPKRFFQQGYRTGFHHAAKMAVDAMYDVGNDDDDGDVG